MTEIKPDKRMPPQIVEWIYLASVQGLHPNDWAKLEEWFIENKDWVFEDEWFMQFNNAETFEAPKTQSLFKKGGMWISDWNKSDCGDDEGCWKRQKEQDSKAKALVAKMKSQGWKRIPNKKVNSAQ